MGQTLEAALGVAAILLVLGGKVAGADDVDAAGARAAHVDLSHELRRVAPRLIRIGTGDDFIDGLFDRHCRSSGQ